jgi:methyl coenzyme M reductase subunit C
MAEDASKEQKPREYEIAWQYDPRLAPEHLGSQKYTSTARAVGELVANGFDAGATVVDITFTQNELLAYTSLSITDNGSGITPDVLHRRFCLVGVQPDEREDRSAFGKFGVGRLAVYRVGSLSDWRTVSATKDGQKIECTFTLNADDRCPLRVKERIVAPPTPTGTAITIFNLLDRGKETPTPARIVGEMTSQFCSFLLGNSRKQITVNGDAIDVGSLVARRTEEVIPRSRTIRGQVKIEHVLLKRSVDESRFPQQVLFTSKGRTVLSSQPDVPLLNNYVALAESRYFESIVSSNREALIQMDEGFAHIRDAVVDRVRGFTEKYRRDERRRFIETARKEDFYPYRRHGEATSPDPVASVQQAVYDVLLEKLNEAVNIEGMTKRQRAAIFLLLRRAFENENFLTVIEEVAALSDEDVEKFKQLLERTTLDSIIRMSAEVTNRLNFLRVLHELVYGDISKHLKERKHLHRILEPHGWLFGPQFHLATSDQSFREVIRKHRDAAGLPPSSDDAIRSVAGVADIPDLFLAASRDYPMHPKNHHLLVELKAPTVPIGEKEIAQIRRYGKTIRGSAEFDKISTRFDVYLVSSEIRPDSEDERLKDTLPVGCIDSWENMKLWVFSWADVIARAREEMQLVKQHLRHKSAELSVSEYLQTHFPEILDTLQMTDATIGDDAVA